MTEGTSGTFLPGPRAAVESPGLGAGRGLGPAFELKFQLTDDEACPAEDWARQHLTADPHGDGGTYRVTSAYCDTAALDVFHRCDGFRRSKYRLRRYGAADRVYLERKSRRGDRVRKRRAEVPAGELALLNGTPAPPDWAGAWFKERVAGRGLRPVCRVAYWRTAFFGVAGGAPVRLTLDRALVGSAASGWEVAPLDDGRPLLPGGVLLELKFHVHLPPLFHGLLPRLPLQPARVSKYRRCAQLCGLLR
jgi:hypothetical protein